MSLKKLLIITTITLIILLLLKRLTAQIFQKPKFDNVGNRTDWSIDEVKQALNKVAKKYGVEYAQNVERLFRVETAHFTSGQFKKTLSPGMEKAGGSDPNTYLSFPYGWSLDKYVATHPTVNKSNFYLHRMPENGTSIGKTFVGFPDINTAIDFVAWHIKNNRDGDFGKWKSKDPTAAARYAATLETVIPRFV